MKTHLSDMIDTLARRLADTLAPRGCAVCGCRLCLQEQAVCSACNISIPRTHYARNPFDNDMAKVFWHLAPIEKAAAWFFYNAGSPTAQAIYKLKYFNRPDIGYALGRIFGQELVADGFFDDVDVIVPVPLAPKRERQRGYNQSVAIAEGMAREAHVDVDRRSLRRTSFAKSQTMLSREEREKNVSGVFELTGACQLAGRGILLVDDVCTTGATLTACAKTISQLPGVRIYAATLAFAGTRYNDSVEDIPFELGVVE